ncbi:hypothetical protein [Rufibacter tibetensis]|uniref:Uncharacterized protein n=1 Tax=Rufibacter tibetensis TaxID=512763 RepID=A0A0P0CVP7_9BACT|nr:hypothetical protein [Rufibacter tibetensis]ALI99412.1 hypothetical protein DC20_11100 [Rufibacter tibetensis]
MPAPVLTIKDKIKIFIKSFLLVLVIYVVIDLYVPIKMMIAGHDFAFSELVSHLQLHKKAPFIVLITWLMSISSFKKKTKALAEKQTESQQKAAL